jgi:hypothetical protein
MTLKEELAEILNVPDWYADGLITYEDGQEEKAIAIDQIIEAFNKILPKRQPINNSWKDSTYDGTGDAREHGTVIGRHKTLDQIERAINE